MSLLHALGINQLAILQFFIFVIIFSFLTFYVFAPFVRANEERQKRTKGGESLAEEYHQKAVELHSQYQDKAREVNGHIQAIFQKNKAAAQVEYDEIVGKARKDAGDVVEKNRQQITRSVTAARDELRGQTTAMALAITNKLLGK